MFDLVLSVLILTSANVYVLGTDVKAANADTTASALNSWFYSGWQYRKEHTITLEGPVQFYQLSAPWTTISGNPADRHALQPVHNTTIIEVDMVVDGAQRKYLAYDSDSSGSQVRLYYTNDINGSWTPYSGNPILGPTSRRYRWPSVTYINGTFIMFLTNLGSGTLEKWISTDGIDYSFNENVKSGGNPYKNPFIWLNPNDGKWYLYSHDSSGGTEYVMVRSAANINSLDTQTDTIVISRGGPLGSPTMTYYGGQYWLLAEIQVSGVWEIVSYYSSTSPVLGFNQCGNSPILVDDEACPMFFLTPDLTQAYLFRNRGSSTWYQLTRSMYVNVTGSQGPNKVTNYQVTVAAHSGSGTDSGQDFYLNGRSRTDFGDLRFTWRNSSTGSEVECNYWIQNMSAGDSAQFWVKIPEIDQGMNNTMYAYYGNSNAVTTNNPNATLEFYDHFNGDLSKWTVLGGTWQIINGQLDAQTTNFGQRIRANGFTFANNSVHVQIEWLSGTYFENGPYVRGQPPNEQNNGYMAILSTYGGLPRDRISKMSGGSETTPASQGTTNPSKNVWYTFVFSLYGNTLKSSISPLYTSQIVASDGSFSNGTLCLFDWSAAAEHVLFDNLFVCKYADPEPAHGSWGVETLSSFVIIDKTFVTDDRADVGTSQTVGIHAQWGNNSSDVVAGRVYVNGTEYITNDTGWANFIATSPSVGYMSWSITGVNCSGISTYVQTASSPSIVWDQIEISEGGVTKQSPTLGETTVVWFKALYEYDDQVFNDARGILYINGSQATWSTTNNRWEYSLVATTIGTTSYTVSGVNDAPYGLTSIDDRAGPQTVTVWSSPFSIVSNSTVMQFAFDSTNLTMSFTVSGPSGTMGYTNVTMAKTLVTNITGLTVYLDGNQIQFTNSSTQFYWLLSFTYHHSTHRVVIAMKSLEQTPQAFDYSNSLLAMALISNLLVGSLIIWKRLRTRKLTPCASLKTARSTSKSRRRLQG